MLEIKFVRQHLNEIKSALSSRGTVVDLETFQAYETKRKDVILEVENLRHRRNVVSDEIADRKQNGDGSDNLVAEMRDVSVRIKKLDKLLSEYEETINKILMTLPNLQEEILKISKSFL